MVTVTSTVPAAPAGDVAVIDVAEFTVMPVAFTAPNFTTVAPARFVPVMVTVVAPVVGPAVGEMEVTVGGGGALMKVTILEDVGIPLLFPP